MSYMNAQEMKQLAHDIDITKIRREIMYKIEMAAKCGKVDCTLDGTTSVANIEWLSGEGYLVITAFEKTFISWG